MADPTVLERDLTPHITGLDRPSLVKAVMDVAREFCRRTHLMAGELAVDVVEDQPNYDLTDPEGMKILAVETVSYKEDGADDEQFAPLTVMSTREYQLFAGGAWNYETAPAPSKFWVTEGMTLYLKPTPNVASGEGLLVEMAIRPDDDSVTVPDFLVNNWRNALRYGALAYLMSQKAMPWFDAAGAKTYAALFEKEVGDGVWRKITGPTLFQPHINIPRI